MAVEKENVKKKSRLLGPIFIPFNIIYSVVMYLIVSIIIGTVIEWIGMSFWWGTSHAQSVFRVEVSYLGDNFSTKIFGISVKEFSFNIIQHVANFLDLNGNSDSSFRFFRWLHTFGTGFKHYVDSFIFVVMTTSVRVLIVIMSSSIFILVFLGLSTDGLAERELRKLGGGVELGTVYHRAKVWISRAITIAPVLYLAWPSSINPNFILLPALTIFGLATYITFATYKKFL